MVDPDQDLHLTVTVDRLDLDMKRHKYKGVGTWKIAGVHQVGVQEVRMGELSKS